MGSLWLVRTFGAVLVRPHLWAVAVRQARRLRRRGWYRAAPFLPVPDPAYMKFRSVTAYGGDGTTPPAAADVLTYLEWCRSQ
jgi:hypothetical protein